jgi:hypothetical protein
MEANLLPDLPSLDVLMAELRALSARIAAAQAAWRSAAAKDGSAGTMVLPEQAGACSTQTGACSTSAADGSKQARPDARPSEPGTREAEHRSRQAKQGAKQSQPGSNEMVPFALEGELVAAGMDNPPSISAKELHGYILRAHQLGNLVQHKFLILLLAIRRGEYFRTLGFNSIHLYSERYFQYEHTATYKCLEVAEALERLPRITEAFDRGQIGWSILMEIVSVASPRSEEAWLRFVRGKTVRQVSREVKNAAAKDRDRPRKRTYGLPGLSVTANFKFAPEEHAIVEKALGKVALETGRSLGGKGLTPQEALVFLAKRTLETGLPGEDGRVELKSSPFTILYIVCPECRTAYISTRDGPVEIPMEVVERVEADARKVVISPEDLPAPIPGEALMDEDMDAQVQDEEIREESSEGEAREGEAAGGNGVETGHAQAQPLVSPPVAGGAAAEAAVPGGAPERQVGAAEAPKDGRGEIKKDKPITRALRLRALLRANNTCENPMCGRTLGLHCHHVVFRSNGGPTCLENTACVCPACHSLVHLAYLKVWRDRCGELHWEPRGDVFQSEFEAAADAVKAIPVVVFPKSAGPAARSGAAVFTSPSQVMSGSNVRDSERPECIRPTSDVAGAEATSAMCTCAASASAESATSATLPRKYNLNAPPLRWIVSALKNLGWSATDAKERVLRAAEFFVSQGKEPREEELLKKALSLKL